MHHYLGSGLRKELELSQGGLAALLGSTDQAVARWEKGRTRVPKWADRLLRLLWREHAEGNVKVRGLIERLNSADEAKAARLVLERRPSGWREAA
ncbi:MAG: helix-turn-helix domain-containing protein [Betaproteobacteria bacterium]|nr:helix-turn-helix domain-containing protein [Betaproteobacteria bacterium]